MPPLYYSILTCEFGSLLLVASDAGLRFIHYYDTRSAARIDGWMLLADATRDDERMRPYSNALAAYLSGETQQLGIALDLQGGTQLQRRVWEVLAQIPYGSTISYSELANRAGAPSAIRAVASACGKNPLPLALPCHRVLAKDGTLGGFTWGLDKKSQLLALEQSGA